MISWLFLFGIMRADDQWQLLFRKLLKWTSSSFVTEIKLKDVLEADSSQSPVVKSDKSKLVKLYLAGLNG